jgi:hypothetical protein
MVNMRRLTRLAETIASRAESAFRATPGWISIHSP